MDAFLFWSSGGRARSSASLLVVGQRNPMYSVLLLIVSFGALSGLYVLLGAPFVAAIQIIIYAGAIMVLFLFVVMLLNVPTEDPPGEPRAPAGRRRAAAVRRGAVGRCWSCSSSGRSVRLARRRCRSGDQAPGLRPCDDIGIQLFREYAFAFEATSVLILVAMVGAIILARKEPLRPCMPEPTLNSYLVLSAVLFAIGTAGVFLRRNLITILLSIEVMLNAVNLTFVAVDRYLGTVDGQIIVFFVMTVAAAEAAVGLAIVIALFRHKETLNPDAFTSLKW